MKFILVISLCSFVNNECLPPVQVRSGIGFKDQNILEISKKLIIAQEDI